jgi:preprotein translocase subunit SecA
MDATQQLGDSFNKVTDFFSAVSSKVERGITGLFGSSNERRVRQIGFVRERDGSSRVVPGSLVDRINQLESQYQALSNDDLRQTSVKLRARLAAGETLEDILPDAFAAARESGWRYLKMRHYDVQLVGGCVLHQGMIAEMTTGEGKTLVATLPAYLNALVGRVHVVTVNDYLAQRDMEWMGALYIGLGLTVGAITSGMDPPGYNTKRKAAYDCDITYGTNNEFGFDYLRDNMKPTREAQVQHDLPFALIDEVDNILIDEARTPLIISGPAHDDITKYQKAQQVALKLNQGVDFEVKEKEHTCHLTDDGIRRAEELAGVESFYTAGNMHWPHQIDNSLKAHHLYKKDVNYVVENGEVVIIDEFTGRKMTGRQWSDGLHQAVEAKEGVRIKEESQTLATITLQNYFKLYGKLAGMTGTAMTEADEFLKIYKLDVLSIPTNRPMRREISPDVIYRSEREKWDAVVDEIKEVHDTGRPVLVGTVSIEKSELLSKKLKRYGIQHNLLNAKFHEREAEIIAQAGRYASVTISTNMAGRGTDIVLGGNPEFMAWEELSKHYATRLDVTKAEWDEKTAEIATKEGMDAEGRKVAEVGGLHVIGTERHDSRRIDLQLRGRAGRQGDPGSSRFFVSLDDDLMRIFMGEWVRNLLTRLGMQEGEAIESGMVTRRIEAAQKKVEERHFETRKHLLEYDEVMDEQRKSVYSYRRAILDGGNCRELLLDMIDRQIGEAVERYIDPMYRWKTIVEWCSQVHHVEIDVNYIRGMERDLLVKHVCDEARQQAMEEIEEHIEENLPDGENESDWNWQALSKWVNLNYSLNTNVPELKKVLTEDGRTGLFAYLNERAHDAVGRFDFEPVDTFIKEDWGAVSLSGWLIQQYTLQVDAADIDGLEPDDVNTRVMDSVRKLYRDKEVRFPVAVGFHGFQTSDGGGNRLDRDGLIRWANDRFDLKIEADDVKKSSDFEQRLLEGSERFLAGGDAITETDDRLEAAYGERNGAESRDDILLAPDCLPEIVDWANAQFQCELTASDLVSATRDAARQRLLGAYDSRFRPELKQAERSVILEILDTAWKDHLYFMDHLKAGVSLMSFAQKDPKVEYRREGRQAFQEMWDRVGQQVTATIFRLENESPSFVGSLWQISAATHDQAANVSDMAASQPAQGGGAEPGDTVKTVAPIRNRGPKVGRNDPCPCDSGKKYKKCCGAAG